MKKRLCLLLSILLCAAALISCASTATTAPASTTAAATPPPAVAQTAAANAQTVNCTVSIDCKTAVTANNQTAKQVSEDGVILASATAAVPANGTVLDALRLACDAAGIPIAVSGSGSTAYVTTINSLSGGDCGSMSGWLYAINGEFATVSCSELKAEEGDVIQFVYTVDGGPDVGLTFE